MYVDFARSAMSSATVVASLLASVVFSQEGLRSRIIHTTGPTLVSWCEASIASYSHKYNTLSTLGTHKCYC